MGCVFVLSYFSRKYIFKECLGIIARAIKYVLFHFLWLLFYDSTDLLTRSKILAFLNIPYWLGLMGFQNKWIGFLNLSKDRAQGLFGTPVASSECRFRLPPSEQGRREPSYQQPVIFDGSRGPGQRNELKGGQADLNMMSAGAVKRHQLPRTL